jgi:NADH-quinone oxidoreductase subunit J
MLDSILFYFFAAIAIVSALLMVTRRNPFHGALFLVLTMLSTAGIFLQLRAEFLFVAQIVLFAAAIPALLIVVVAILRHDQPAEKIQFSSRSWVAAATASALVLEIAAMFLLIRKIPGDGTLILHNITANKLPPNSEALAHTLFTSYLLPFEIAALLLLVAVIGAVSLTRVRNHAS